MPRINGTNQLPPVAPQSNGAPRNGNQGVSHARRRSLLGSIGAALGNLGRSSNRETQAPSTGNHSASPPRRAAPTAAPSRHTPARAQPDRTPLQTLERAGVDPQAFQDAMSNLVATGRDLPPSMKAALERVGVDTHIATDGAPMINPPLLVLSRGVTRELRSRPSIETLHRAGIDPQAFVDAVARMMTIGRELPAGMKAALERAGVDTRFDPSVAFNSGHPLVNLQVSVRRALAAQTPSASPSRFAGSNHASPARTPGRTTPNTPNTPPRPGRTLRRAAPIRQDSPEFANTVVFPNTSRDVGGR